MSAVLALVCAVAIGWGIWGTAWLSSRAQTQLGTELSQFGEEYVPGTGPQLPAASADVDPDAALEEVIEDGAPSVDASASVADALSQPANPAPVVDLESSGVSTQPASNVTSPSRDTSGTSSTSPSSSGQYVPYDPTDISRFDSPKKDITPFPPQGWKPPEGRDVNIKLPGKEGKATGRIRIPAIGVDAALVAGTSWDALANGPGIWRHGAVPTQPGNATVAAHRNGWGEWFNQLDKLKYGDLIYVDMPGAPQAVYEVRGRLVVNPAKVSVTDHTDGVRLTLSTCHPDNSGTYRLIVQAEMVQGAWLDQALNRSEWRLQY